jgi:hypothetical protein
MTHAGSDSDGGFARRTILRAAGLSGVAGLAGCMSQTVSTAATGDGTEPTQADDDGPALPETGSPEVVDLDERGREVTLRSVHARHAAHPGGMVTAIVYEQAMGTDVFADLMEKAGYEL